MNAADLDALVFDFDGVLTDNRVYVDAEGRETVCCNRADGLAFDVFRKLPFKVFILSTETNPVVAARAAKLKVPAFQGLSDKLATLHELCRQEDLSMDRILFVGNDLNDFRAMKACGYSACPADSHPAVQQNARFPLSSKGGDGVAREILENILNINPLDYLVGGHQV